jgi:hypothetical protein
MSNIGQMLGKYWIFAVQYVARGYWHKYIALYSKLPEGIGIYNILQQLLNMSVIS